MPRCSCAGNSCSCAIQSGTGITITGTGSATAPFVVSTSTRAGIVGLSADGVLDLSDVDSDSLIEVLLHEDVNSVVLPADSTARISLALRQGAIPNTVVWPANVRWAGGVAPTLSTTAGDLDWLAFRQLGDIWLGAVEGAAIH
jgi:hypothetical protein